MALEMKAHAESEAIYELMAPLTLILGWIPDFQLDVYKWVEHDLFS